jgi:Flp pilus assembly protein TadD
MVLDKNYMHMVMAGHYEKNGDMERAEAFYRKSLSVAPSVKAHEKLGLILKDKGDIEGAVEHFGAGLAMEPDNKTCLYNIGVIERLRGRYDSAMEKYQRLMGLGVDDAGVYMSMGVLHSETGEMEEALKNYEEAFGRNPDNDLVRFNYSLCLMTLGDFGRGLELYESRIWHALPPGEPWNGESDISLLVAPEQGNGDIIQFARYLPELRKRCRKLTVLCNAPLVDLIGKVEGVDEVMEFNPGDEFVEVENEVEDEDMSKPLPFERFVRIMSIPHIMGIDPSKQEFKKYLKTDDERVEYWAGRIRSKKIKVGLCWQGGKRDKPDMIAIDKKRSIPLRDMMPILSAEGVDFFSLQRGDDQNDEFPSIIDFMDEAESFSETAAIIENLDLVISVDTAVAHLAAALGKPTWMLARKGGCWRWGTEGEKTFWYPSMKIFRQDSLNDWSSAISSIGRELRSWT